MPSNQINILYIFVVVSIVVSSKQLCFHIWFFKLFLIYFFLNVNFYLYSSCYCIDRIFIFEISFIHSANTFYVRLLGMVQLQCHHLILKNWYNIEVSLNFQNNNYNSSVTGICNFTNHFHFGVAHKLWLKRPKNYFMKKLKFVCM